MELRPVRISEAEKVRHLEEQVTAEVGAGRYFPLSEEARTAAIDRRLAYGAFDGEQLVALCVGFTESADRETFKDKVRNWNAILEQNAFIRIAYVALSSVRGKGLIKELLAASLSAASREGCRHAIATVAADNGPSIKILIDAGFQVQFVGPVYGDKVRIVTHRRLGPLFDSVSPTEWIPSTDIQRQQELLGQGYLGVAAKRESDHVLIGYERRL
jgi:GNAT superfamily N-acetyltransferase